MNRYNRSIRNMARKSLYEDEEEDIVIKDTSIQDEVYQIVNNLGYSFSLNKNNSSDGTISISDNLTIYIRFIGNAISRIYIRTNIDNDRLDCTRNTAMADNISVDLQTCVLIIKEIRQKLM